MNNEQLIMKILKMIKQKEEEILVNEEKMGSLHDNIELTKEDIRMLYLNIGDCLFDYNDDEIYYESTENLEWRIADIKSELNSQYGLDLELE